MGMCAACYVEYVKVCGGIQTGAANPPAFAKQQLSELKKQQQLQVVPAKGSKHAKRRKHGKRPAQPTATVTTTSSGGTNTSSPPQLELPEALPGPSGTACSVLQGDPPDDWGGGRKKRGKAATRANTPLLQGWRE